MASKQDLIKEIDDEFGDSFDSLEGCTKVLLRMENELKNLEEKITLSDENCSIGQTVARAKDVIRKIDETLVESGTVSEEIEEYLKATEETRKAVQQYFIKLNTLQSIHQYLRILQFVEDLSIQLQKQIASKDDEMCATVFANLCEVFRNLLELPPTNLLKHIKEVVIYWHNMLKEKFAKDLEEVMVSLKWPFVNTNFSLQIPSQVHIKKLQIVSEYLLQIELPTESIEMSSMVSDFPPLCLPIHYLVLPLRKRFLYHFYGARQTNRIDKPEWYFTQVLSWIRDHKDFVRKWIQPVINKFGFHHIEADVELMRGLVQLAIEKLQSDLPTVQYDDYIFSHSIDEALGFHKELVETYLYPPNQPSILAVLTQAQVFMKWLAMEKKYAMEKMDAMLLQSSAESFQAVANDVDDLKITGCADMFITLLQTITERYENLPQPGHRLQFLELQLELLDDFRIRLLQIAHEEQIVDIVESKIPMIANTLYYIENVLLDWGAMLHYLSLYYYKSQMEDAAKKTASATVTDLDENFDLESETVFEETLSLYRHMRRDLLCTLSEFVMVEAKNRSKHYRRERWFTMENSKDFQSLSLTPSACPMFEIIGTRLHQLQKTLTSILFRIVWRYIAQQLDTFLFEELILENRFSEAGALQLKYDVTRNLLPLFSQFSERPESYFTRLTESCTLLNISKGSALLLRETLQALEGATGVEDIRGKALAEIGVSNFTPRLALNILNRRTDITTNRMVID